MIEFQFALLLTFGILNPADNRPDLEQAQFLPPKDYCEMQYNYAKERVFLIEHLSYISPCRAHLMQEAKKDAEYRAEVWRCLYMARVRYDPPRVWQDYDLGPHYLNEVKTLIGDYNFHFHVYPAAQADWR